MKPFKYYQDYGHGWIAVKLALLKEVGIENDISSCSYVRGATAYLEEDSDAGKFIQAFIAKFGCKPSFESRYINGRSPIRSYNCYSVPQVPRDI